MSTAQTRLSTAAPKSRILCVLFNSVRIDRQLKFCLESTTKKDPKEMAGVEPVNTFELQCVSFGSTFLQQENVQTFKAT